MLETTWKKGSKTHVWQAAQPGFHFMSQGFSINFRTKHFRPLQSKMAMLGTWVQKNPTFSTNSPDWNAETKVVQQIESGWAISSPPPTCGLIKLTKGVSNAQSPVSGRRLSKIFHTTTNNKTVPSSFFKDPCSKSHGKGDLAMGGEAPLTYQPDFKLWIPRKNVKTCHVWSMSKWFALGFHPPILPRWQWNKSFRFHSSWCCYERLEFSIATLAEV